MKLLRRTAIKDATLLVAEPVGAEVRLVDRHGAPVWPMADEADRLLLQEIARTFGAELLETQAELGTVESSSEIVCAVGSGEQEAPLYAHLTGRSWMTVKRCADIPLDQPPAVVLCVGRNLDPALVEMLMLIPRGAPVPGIVWARTPHELHQRVLTSAAAATLHGPLRGLRRTDIVAEARMSVLEVRRRRQLGKEATREDVEGALGALTGLLSMSAHGEPWMVDLPGGTALCMWHEPPSGADRKRAPSCVEHGYCSVVRQQVSVALGTQLLDPDIISARVVALTSCMGIGLGSDAVSAEWSFLPTLLSNPSVGAVLASPELCTIRYADLSHELLGSLESGMAVGATLRQFELGSEAARLGQRLLLFGDPRTCAAPEPQEPDRVVEQQAVDDHHDVPDSPHPDLAILRGIEALQRPDHPEAGFTAMALSEALDRVEAVNGGAPSARSEAAVRAAVLEHVATMRGRTADRWPLHVDYRRADTVVPCPSCQWRLRPYYGRVGALTRVVIDCPRCKNVADRPEGSTLDIEVDLPRVSLVGELPERDWAGALYIAPDVLTDLRSYPWPVAPSGAPARSYVVNRSSWPPGALGVRVVIVEGVRHTGVGRIRRAPTKSKRHR